MRDYELYITEQAYTILEINYCIQTYWLKK